MIQIMHHPTRLLTYGFIIILTMMAFLVFTANPSDPDSSQLVGHAVTRHLEKVILINEISSNIHNRMRFTQSILLDKNALNSNTVWNDFKQFTTSYQVKYKQLVEISSASEIEAIMAIDPPLLEFTSLNRQALISYLNGRREQANKIFLDEVSPNATLILDQLDSLIRILRTDLSGQLLVANADAEKNQTRLIIYAISILIISLGFAVLAVWYNQRLVTQLQAANTYLEEQVSERTESLLDTQKELIEDNSELARLASTDNLTGLANRSYMSEILQKEFSRYIRYNQLFGIIMLDIDHFKDVNDNYGHDVGDKVLIELSHQLEQAIRNSDYTSRWGGEEFLICCTTINPDDLQTIAETIRQKICDTDFNITEGITASLGCAIIQPDEIIKELIKRADIALYAAKHNGRNQIVISEFIKFT